MGLPAFFDPIVVAPRWQKVVLGLLGLTLLLAGTYFLLLSPLQADVSSLRGKNAALQSELSEARVAVADLARARREAADLERQLDGLKERLPGDKDIPPLFRSLTDAAFQSGLSVALFQPREGKIHDYYVELPLAMTAEGGYHDLGVFFARVAALPRVVTIDEIKVTGLGKSKGSLRTELTLATYQYRPLGSPPAPKPGQPGGKK